MIHHHLLVMTEKPKEAEDKGKGNVAAVVNLLKAHPVLNLAKLLLCSTYSNFITTLSKSSILTS